MPSFQKIDIRSAKREFSRGLSYRYNEPNGTVTGMLSVEKNRWRMDGEGGKVVFISDKVVLLSDDGSGLAGVRHVVFRSADVWYLMLVDAPGGKVRLSKKR